MTTCEPKTGPEIRQQAANLKLKLQKRAVKLKELHSNITDVELGIANSNPRPNTFQSWKDELAERQHHQWRDRMQYATLRWVLGITETIDVNNLDLYDAKVQHNA
jgi:hypothetical protein